MSEKSKLLDYGNFIILIVSGAIIPLLLVLYKSRCSSICFGCVKREVLDEDDDNIEKKSLSEMNNSVKKELKLELADEPAVED
tara:strand:+ start:120 stop:368 length:249 start_codon:yes stop_codon:yes gene_type:complete